MSRTSPIRRLVALRRDYTGENGGEVALEVAAVARLSRAPRESLVDVLRAGRRSRRAARRRVGSPRAAADRRDGGAARTGDALLTAATRRPTSFVYARP
ncbi:hypothetical protein FHR81_000585 [Actinoalloteichus hoggarensis]|uniref:hypothetical protein n=1 Tax=Actinoalloteichus hoggarensis TaxID=1470176 RepID=UPI0012FE4846|nr:hypothetical protein [Actinoalloteichus hoggarensis]MBB5919556.1 hypothetical protein [Actinoalloteichus hoggarensis]